MGEATICWGILFLMATSPHSQHPVMRSGRLARLLNLGPRRRVLLGLTLELDADADRRSIAYVDIESLSIQKQLIGCRVMARLCNGEKLVLASHVRKHIADDFALAFSRRKEADQASRREAIQKLASRLIAAAKSLEQLFNRTHYIAESEFLAWHSAHTIDPSEVAFRSNDLDVSPGLKSAHQLFRAGDEGIRKRLEARNAKFVQNELRRCKPFFDEIETHPLTERQRLAVVINEDRNLIVAGAGTGKTSTVVARVGYLLNKGVLPEEILVLAFARKAKRELEERIQERIGQRVEVRTFHSLGRMILGQAGGKVPTISKVAEDDKELERRIGCYLDEMLEDPRARETLLAYFAFHLKPREPTDKFKTADDQYRYLRAHGIRSLAGELVKSQQEASIANWLLLHGVRYEYEAQYAAVNTADTEHRQYQPDFYLPDQNIYLEHFGVDREGKTAPYINALEYRQQMEWKRALHAEHGTKLLETYSYQFQEGTIWDDLKGMLIEHGVVIEPISNEALRQVIASSNESRPLIRLLASFLQLFKSTDGTLAGLRSDASRLDDPARAAAFLDLFEWVYGRHEADLVTEQALDFTDLIRDANAAVRSDSYRSVFSHILVDEFQDIAVGRASLVRSLLDQAPHSRLFAVGDDWQSIYRFTGSDVGLMTNFQNQFGATCRTDLDRTFRYTDRLLKASTRFITRNPDQLVKDLAANQVADEPVIGIRLVRRDEITGRALDEVLRMIAGEASDGPATVMLLGRYRHTLTDVPNNLKANNPGLAIEARTLHAAKGLEADYVVVLDVSGGRYGFPSEIADDPVLALVQSADSDYPNAEERRLFYVALTRARRRVFLIGDEASASPFIGELQHESYAGLVHVQSTGFEPVTCPECGGRLVKRSGPHGQFWACCNFPYCRGKGSPCGFCGGVLIRRADRFHCNREGCEFDAEVCPACGKGNLKIKTGPYGRFWACNRNSTCRYTRSVAKDRRR